jgi:HEPN domain-containing protein
MVNKKYMEWLKQADYDIDTAEYMYNGKRFFYAVFMCHMAVEKALKGLYQQRLCQIPPKTHNLIFLLNEMGIKPEEIIGRFIAKLNEANIPTRYPENIEILQTVFTQPVTEQMLAQTKDVLEWIKKQF